MKKIYEPYLVPFLAFLIFTCAGAWLPAHYKLTVSALTELRKQGLPEPMLASLVSLENQDFATRQTFEAAIAQRLGTEQATEYRPRILAAAEIPLWVYIFYPIKTIVVGLLLYYYYHRKAYPEITLKCSWMAVFVGIAVFIAWVVPEGWYPLIGSSKFDPYTFGLNWLAYLQIAGRLIGAVIVVPIFEELFWRSFAIRWLIDEDFTRVPIGTFTWFSCAAIILGFGFEHDRWLVGLLAGVGYNALLYYRKNLSDCIVAHAATNLLLGIYVLLTHKWTFW